MITLNVDLRSTVPDYLAELPIDPFTGTAVDYRLHEEGLTLTAAKGIVEPIHPKRGDLVLHWEIPRDPNTH